jgi:serine/threonine-protein kinase RsbW
MQTASADFMLRINSKPGNIRFLESFVERLASEHQLTKQQYQNIYLCLTEAVTNAIVHGNQADERKKVVVQAAYADQHLVIKVEDEGCGFDLRKLPDPTKTENIYNIGGRGVFIIHNYADTVRYERNGCAVEMGFNI